jgi:hypothetical protein
VQSINAVGKVNAWGVEQQLVDNNNDFDNQDINGTAPFTHLFLVIAYLEENTATSEVPKEKINLTFGYIRGPPTYNV